jgi:putative endonuclease
MAWFVYLIECLDGSLYTGVAVDVERRYALHAAGKGARYTRSHPPRRLAAVIAHDDRGSAQKHEYRIKQLAPAAKQALCRRHPPPGPPVTAPALAAEREPDAR